MKRGAFSFSEILHRLRDPGAAAGAVHAEGDGQLQVQDLEGGRLHAVRVLHHDPHRTQHHPTHDESECTFSFPVTFFFFLKKLIHV